MLRQYSNTRCEDLVAVHLGGVPGHVVHQPLAGGVVHHLVDQGVGLAVVVVLGVERVGGPHHLAVGGPHGVLGVGDLVGRRRALDGVRVVDGVGHVVDPHRPVLRVAAHRRPWAG